MAAKLIRLTHKIEMQLHLVAESCTICKFSLQAASPETFGYTLVSWVSVRVKSNMFHNLDVSTKKSMFICRQQKAGQNHNMKTSSKSLKNIAQ